MTTKKEIFGQQMAEAKPALHAAIKSVSGIKKRNLVEIPAELPKNPPDTTLWAFQGALILLGHEKIDWRQCKQVMTNAKFVRNMIDLDFDTIHVTKQSHGIPIVKKKIHKSKSQMSQETTKLTQVITTNISLLISHYNIDLAKPLMDIIIGFTFEIESYKVSKGVSLYFWNEINYNYEYAIKRTRSAGPLVMWTKSVIKYCLLRQTTMDSLRMSPIDCKLEQ